MVYLERDAKIGEKNEEISSENSCGRTIAKTVDFPSVDLLNPLGIQKESRLLAPSLNCRNTGSDPDFSSVSYVRNSLNLNLGYNTLNFGKNCSWVFSCSF